MDDFELGKKGFFGDAIISESSGVLSEKFIVPPFSILNARDGIWQSRKKAWLNIGIQSEVGRSSGIMWGDSPEVTEKGPNYYRNKNKDVNHASVGMLANAKSYNVGNWMEEKAGGSRGNQIGTSIFDPVLCELAYKWFCPVGGQVIDPFAGGSVRGIVASLLGYKYYGIELRPEQVAANEQQRQDLAPNAEGLSWRCGDAMDELEDAPNADFIFTCPPYGDLERYSDDPRDLSTMEYHTFIAKYKQIILRSVKKLKEDRFACIVVGDFRDKKTGNYRNFVSDTIQGFLDAGCGLYNDAILVTAVGSLPIRVRKQFEASRKLGKTHQNVLIFVRGEGKAAAKGIAMTKTDSSYNR